MKLKLVTIFTFLSITTFSQVGINTENPQAIFHVDGLNDNKTSTTLSSTQQNNDFVVTTNGNVGIGVVNPEKKLEIISGGTSTSPVIGVKIKDGNEGKGKVLVSDEDGNATWKSLFSSKENYGNFNWGAETNLGNTNWNSIASLTITPGTHMIYYRLHVLNNSVSNTSTTYKYARIYVGNRYLWNNGNSKDTPIIGTTNFQPFMGRDFEIALSFMYTNNTTSNQTIYLNFQSDYANVQRSKYAQQSSVEFAGVNLIENYFYSVKVD